MSMKSQFSIFTKSKIFLFTMLSFLGGVFYATFFGFDLFLVLFVFSIIAVFLFSFFQKKHIFLLFIFFLIFFAGIFWYQKSSPKYLSLEKFVGENIEISGIILREPEFKGVKQKIILQTKEKERVLIKTERYPEYEYGDLILVRGELKEPENFNDFDYRAYLSKDNIYFLMQNPKIEVKEKEKGNVIASNLFKFKKEFENNIKILLPSPEADFINGVIFGSKSEIPPKLYDDFIKTGTAHIIALSGFNVTIIVMFLAWIFSFFISNRKVIVLTAIFTITLFVVMTGASASVVRAALMGSVLLLARYYGRAQHSLNALVFAAFLMILFNPKILVFDVSFQLSFLATLGLLYFYPYFLKKFKKIPNFFKLRDTLSATLSAQAAVLPILIYNFNQISVISPLANILILPVIPIAMLLAFLTGVLSFVSLFLAKIFVFPLWFILAYQLKVIEVLGSLSFSSISF